MDYRINIIWMDSTKETNIKNRRYYFFLGLIDIKNLDQNKVKIDEKTYKNIFIDHIRYGTVKNLSYVKINSVHLLYLNIVNK